MCKLTSYSRYQKRAIKFLSEFLGTSRPFSYVKANNNHLKVLIKGVPKPIYTGCTPSDCRSIKAFMAEVKRAVKESDNPRPENAAISYNETAVVQKHQFHEITARQEKIIQSVVRAMRNRIEVIKAKEEEMVMVDLSFDEVGNSRKSVIKEGLDLALKSNKQGSYFTAKELKKMSESVREHLDFMLPTMAYYSDKLYANRLSGKQQLTTDLSSVSPVEDKQEVCRIDKESDETRSTKSEVKPEIRANVSNCKDKVAKKSNPIAQIVNMGVKSRQLHLRKLTLLQAKSLISDIEQAMEANREQDMRQVINLIKEKQLCIDEIANHLVS
jgi:hypothetical protein